MTERIERTAQGIVGFAVACARGSSTERTQVVLTRTQYPSDIIALVVLWRLRYRLTLRDLSEMFLMRGVVFSYEAVRAWQGKLVPTLATELRQRRRDCLAPSWFVDEKDIKVRGNWRYLYRAVDRDGALVDVMLSERRDPDAANAFFRSAKVAAVAVPDRVSGNGHAAYPQAIRTEFGESVSHRTNTYLSNRLEQDHRWIKGRVDVCAVSYAA